MKKSLAGSCLYVSTALTLCFTCWLETTHGKGAQFQPGCLISGSKSAMALLVFEIESKAKDGPLKGKSTKPPRIARYFDCSLNNECTMIKFPFEADISMMNIHTINGKILKIGKSVAIIDFGTNGLITIDTEKNLATYYLSGPSFEDRGIAKCN